MKKSLQRKDYTARRILKQGSLLAQSKEKGEKLCIKRMPIEQKRRHDVQQMPTEQK